MTKRNLFTGGGAPNFRDLGGYPAADGKTVKWKKVFRSDDLYALSDMELELFAALDVRTVVDFRDRQEMLRLPDRLPQTVASSIAIPIEAGKLMHALSQDILTPDLTAGVMISVYRALVHDFQAAYRHFFRLLSESGNLPLLFHCTAGKDRTGFAAAMFLSALGVDRKTIFDDYLLSNACLAGKYVQGVDYDETTRPLFQVQPEFLEAAFDAIETDYGGVERYLHECLRVDCAYFRDIFTEMPER